MDVKAHGSGIWYCLHMKSYKIKDVRDVRAFLKFVEELREELPCDDCRIHMNKYCDEHRPENKWKKTYKLKNGREVNGLFYWSWKFHDAVNKRIKKKRISLDEAYEIYSKKESCGKACVYVPNNLSEKDYIKGYIDGTIKAKPL